MSRLEAHQHAQVANIRQMFTVPGRTLRQIEDALYQHPAATYIAPLARHLLDNNITLKLGEQDYVNYRRQREGFPLIDVETVTVTRTNGVVEREQQLLELFRWRSLVLMGIRMYFSIVTVFSQSDGRIKDLSTIQKLGSQLARTIHDHPLISLPLELRQGATLP